MLLPDSLNSGKKSDVQHVIYPRRTGHFTHVTSVNAVKSPHKLHFYPASERTVCTMASKRRQDESEKTEKKKKKKSCEETAELCSVVEDEQVKRAVKEAWSHKTPYSHGQYRETSVSYLLI